MLFASMADPSRAMVPTASRAGYGATSTPAPLPPRDPDLDLSGGPRATIAWREENRPRVGATVGASDQESATVAAVFTLASITAVAPVIMMHLARRTVSMAQGRPLGGDPGLRYSRGSGSVKKSLTIFFDHGPPCGQARNEASPGLWKQGSRIRLPALHRHASGL